MSKNYFEIELGGQKMGGKLNNRTINFIGDITGSDPLAFAPTSGSWPDLSEYARVILTAALKSNLASKKEEPTFTDDDVKEWMNDLEPKDLYMVMQAYREFLLPPADREVSKDTREGADLARA